VSCSREPCVAVVERWIGGFKVASRSGRFLAKNGVFSPRNADVRCEVEGSTRGIPDVTLRRRNRRRIVTRLRWGMENEGGVEGQCRGVVWAHIALTASLTRPFQYPGLRRISARNR
jgi:hypothetical protein